MGIKITASGERVFRLRSCSEDDTIFLRFLSIIFGYILFYCRFLLTQEPVLTCKNFLQVYLILD